MLLSLLTLALASTTLAQYTVESPPFHLVVLSDNSTINGSTLTSCHEGAGIESLCLGSFFTPPLAASVYNHNTSSYNVTYNESLGEPGYLAWELQGSNFNVSSALRFTYNLDSNVAHPQFFPGGDTNAVLVAFDEEGKLNIQAYVDDRTEPATISSTGGEAYYRWVVCVTYTQGYTYQTVNWVMGEAEAQNPTCQSVTVTRVFLPEADVAEPEEEAAPARYATRLRV